MSFGSSSSRNIKKKRDGSFSNSSKSLTVEVDSNKEITNAYSYAEIICMTFHEKECLVFNFHKFSNTTSGHQSAIHSFMTDKFPGYETLTVDCRSLNRFDGKNPDSLGNVRYTEGLKKLFNFFGFSAKALADIKAKTEKEDEENRIYKNEQARAKNLSKKILALNYKTPDALEKAIKTFLEMGNRSWEIEIRNVSGGVSELLYFKETLDKTGVSYSAAVKEMLKGFQFSISELEETLVPLFRSDKVSKYEGEKIKLHYRIERTERAEIVAPAVLKYDGEIFNLDEEQKAALTIYANRIKTIKTLAELGDEDGADLAFSTSEGMTA